MTITVSIRLAWWFVPYVRLLVFFCNVSGGAPDPDKLRRIFKAAVRYN